MEWKTNETPKQIWFRYLELRLQLHCNKLPVHEENTPTPPHNASVHNICDPIQQKVTTCLLLKQLRCLHYLTEDLTSFPMISH